MIPSRLDAGPRDFVARSDTTFDEHALQIGEVRGCERDVGAELSDGDVIQMRAQKQPRLVAKTCVVGATSIPPSTITDSVPISSSKWV